MNAKHLFIIGVGRSGTSLLQSMMNAHKSICFLPEVRVIHRYVFKELNRSFAQLSVDDLRKRLVADDTFNRLQIDHTSIIKNIKTDSRLELLTAFLNAIYQAFLEQTGKTIIGDKDPANVQHLPIIQQLYPKSKIIHIIRDARDVILSRKKSAWGKRSPFVLHVFRYKMGIKLAPLDGKRLFGKHYYEIRYEDLLTCTEEALRNLCDQLGLDFDYQMLEHHKSAEKVVGKDEIAWKGNVLKPVLKGNSEKWRKELSAFEILIIESLLFKELNKFNYQPKFSQFSFIRLLFAITLYPIYGLFIFLKKLLRYG